MTTPQRPQNSDPSDRASRILQIVEDCMSRRAGGEDVSDEQLVDSHPDLMPELRDELRKLALVERARAQAARTARLPEAGSSELDDRFAEPLPDWFPGYDIVREVHRGGQGVVYQAIQKSTKRKVAIKVMREGPFAGPRDRSRFEREVQILGQLDHPGIVRIHDSGTAAGSFFYVMDYISGQALDAYTAGDGRSIDATLRLFVKVCEAVNAAHLRGVIHRDLKPSNIRVDSAGEPHVLDFGLAKLATQPLTEESQPRLMSLTGQFIGSLPWASPEQAEGSPEKIDTRTDVYSLGVVLYQMLTGQFPYPVTGNMREVLDNILMVEPTRPRTVRTQIDDEVETLVLKCLRKERERRYQTAGELARDVQHYLAGEPIEAKRDSGWYMLTKTLSRYRVPVVVCAAFVMLIAVFAVTMTLMYQHADRQARKAELYAAFLDKTLASVDPDVAVDRDVTLLRDLLDKAAERVDELADQPEVEAAVRNTIGRTYLKIGHYDKAAQHLKAALGIRRHLFGDEHLDVAETLSYLGWALKELDDYAAAEPLYQEALRVRRGLLGEEHELVAEVLNNLGQLRSAQKEYDGAEQLLRAALEMRLRLLGDEHCDVASSLANLGLVLQKRERFAEAEQLLHRALDMRRKLLGDHPHTANSLNKLGLLFYQKRDYPAAERLHRQALEMRRAVLPADHPHIAVTLHNLALVAYGRRDLEQAEELTRLALEVWNPRAGEEDADVATALCTLAAVLDARGAPNAREEAERLCRSALEVRERLFGTEHEEIAKAQYLLGRILARSGRVDDAEPLLRASLGFLVREHGEGHLGTSSVRDELVGCLVALRRFEEAESLLLESHAAIERDHGPADKLTVSALKRLIELNEAWGKPDRAEEYRALLPKAEEASAGD